MLTLAASGWTIDNLFVLYDHETESLWFSGFGGGGRRNLSCVAGELQEEKLLSFPFERTSWQAWVTINAGSLLMIVK